MNPPMKIISGGQTGVDRAALDAALALGYTCGVWCPKGRRAEDGPLDERYALKETANSEYEVGTEWNVRDSDATLIMTRGKPKTGTGYTIAMTRVHKKPYLIVDLEKMDLNMAVGYIREWLDKQPPKTLNIAGPRESNMPGIYEDVKKILWKLFAA